MLLISPIAAQNYTIDNTTQIQDAINIASDNDIIYLNPGTYHESGIIINKDLTLHGLGNAEDIVIDAQKADRIIKITTKSNIVLKNITFTNGKSDNYGGAIFTETAESVKIANCIFTNNTAIKDGGAVEIDSKFNPNPREFFYGHLEIDNTTFENNYGYSGGAVGTYYTDSDIKNTRFIANTALDFAGALSLVNGNMNVSSSIFDGNYADYDGGAIRQNMNSQLSIANSTFINNGAKEWGGALYNWLGSLNVENSTISNNTAGIRGGGIFTAGPLTVTDSKVSNNAAEHGGALYVFQEFFVIEPIVTFNNNTIEGNTAQKGSIVFYLLLNYTKSDYENNYWGDINPNSPRWEDEFVVNEYTEPAPKTWIEKPAAQNETVPQNATNITNTSKIENHTQININNTDTMKNVTTPDKNQTENITLKENHEKISNLKQTVTNNAIGLLMICLILPIAMRKIRL